MASWQRDQLKGLDDIAYVVAAHADQDGDEADGDDLLRWKEGHGFSADALLIDDGRHVIDAYINDNPDHSNNESITVIIDKQMRIRRVGNNQNLSLLLELSDETPSP